MLLKHPVKKERPVNVDTHTVVAGDTLYRLAEKYYDDPTVWIKIYEANEDTIEDKGLLKKGQVLIIASAVGNYSNIWNQTFSNKQDYITL